MNKVRIHTIESLNHNVRRLVTDKPEGYEFEPGQATLVAVDKEGFRDEKRPFTFTSLPSEEHLEFTIKTYPSHEGVTDKIDDLAEGDHLLIEDPWGAITYQGKGVFIAGGAGLTPMLAILRDQANRGNDAVELLIFSNRTGKDLFLKEDLEACTNGKVLLTFTQETVDGAEKGRVNRDFLKRHVDRFDQFFYVCGPPEMVDSVSGDLEELGADPDRIVVEES
ncbi:MAG: FAD-binding oxidoreductase [Puniceicoccaceae bacterium]